MFLILQSINISSVNLIILFLQNSPKITFDKKKGLPIKLDMPGVSDPPSFQQNFYYYESAVGNNAVFENRSSGAYIFRPNSSLIIVNPQPSVKYYKGGMICCFSMLEVEEY